MTKEIEFCQLCNLVTQVVPPLWASVSPKVLVYMTQKLFQHSAPLSGRLIYSQVYVNNMAKAFPLLTQLSFNRKKNFC